MHGYILLKGMPRRKQNTPKRLKSEDESEDGLPESNGGNNSDSSSDSEVENNSMDEHSQSEEDSDGEMMDDAGQNSIVERDTKLSADKELVSSGESEAKYTVEPKFSNDSEDHEKDKIKKKFGDDDNDDDDDGLTNNGIKQKESVANEPKAGDQSVPSSFDNKAIEKKVILDKHKDVNDIKEEGNIASKSKICKENKPDDNTPSKSDHDINHPNDSKLHKRLEKTPDIKTENKQLSEHQREKSSETHRSKIMDSTKHKVKADIESPISKLLSMVNNPEKIQTKHSYSNSFSLAASSPKMMPALSSKPPVSTTLNTSSSPVRSSKPLSGFLPPYSMYSQLQSMYTKMNKVTNHSMEEKDSSSLNTLPPSPVPAKKTDSKSSPSPGPASDQDQPLDLSVKSKGLDLSVRSKSESDIQNEGHDKRDYSGRKKHIPASSSDSVNSSEVSSLKSLEEKFGGNPFKVDKTQRGPKGFMPYMHPMLPMYGGALYTPALFSTHPWMHTEKLARSEISPRKPNVSVGSTHSSNSPSKTSSHNINNSEVRSPSKLSPTLMSKMTDKESFYNKKYTNLKCSCKKEFETLYQLTLHLKQTGHTPSTRMSGQQEFPKLVRGQDMWLNHGSEQTKQILRCIRCGESFKTLPELTVHMMKTKHYANIVGSDSNRKVSSRQPSEFSELDIYKCFQCEESFSGMEEFSKHMLSSGHHKSPIIIQPMSPALVSPGSDRTTPRDRDSDSREPSPKRLRTLSEASSGGLPSMVKINDRKLKFDKDISNFSDKDENSWDSFSGEDNKIRCETCGDKIEMSKFVEHVRQCVRNSAWDYCTPLKKRRLTSDEKEHTALKSDLRRSSSISNDDKLVNGRFTPSSPKSSECTRDTSLVQPPSDNSNDGSALRAMESFIEQSFTPSKKEKSSFFGFGSMSRSVFPMPYVNGHSPKPPSRNSAPPVNSSISGLYNKYLPPLYLKPTEDSSTHSDSQIEKDVKSETAKSPGAVKMDKSEFKTLEVTNENNNKEIKFKEKDSEVETSHSDIKENHESMPPSPTTLQEKYLNVADRGSTTPVSKSEPTSSSTSALESLQGLVYGKSFESEHPLDSLQKLIHSTDGQTREIPNGAFDAMMCNRPLIKEAFPAGALLKSSLLPGLQTGGGCLSGPESPSKSESSISPAPESHTSDRHTPDLSSENEGSKHISEGEAEKTDTQGDYVCQACTRSFATIGTYRFHTSRCHLSKAKKYQYKENLNKTPYVYLPLDHSAKFNKYYELANELANKTK